MQKLLHDIDDPQLYPIVDSIPFGDKVQFKTLLEAFPNYDPGFLWMLSYQHEGYAKNRAYIDASYKQYRQVLDKQFPNQFPKKNKFVSRMWEMILCDTLSGSGALAPRSSKGPDFLLTSHEGESIRIEAVAPDEAFDINKRAVRPDYSKSNIFSVAGNIEDMEYPILSRVFNKGFIEKAHRKQYETDKPLIIAINSSKIVGISSRDEYILRRILFGLGYDTLTWGTDGVTHRGLQFNDVIKRSEKSDLNTGVFLDDKYNHISGVIYTSQSPLDLLPSMSGLSKNSIVYVPNPKAKHPVVTKFPFFKTITYDGFEYQEIPAIKEFVSAVSVVA